MQHTKEKKNRSSINKEYTASFAISLAASILVCILATWLSYTFETVVFKNELSMQEIVAFVSIPFFSTVFTFCITTVIQNFVHHHYELKVDRGNIKMNIISLFAAIVYLFLYVVYYLASNIVLGYIFLGSSVVMLVLSVLSFGETYPSPSSTLTAENN
jgi:O-antigen/teichoic acid export membrane protein